MNDIQRWIIGGICGLALTLGAGLVGFQSAVDARQNEAIDSVSEESRREDDKHEAVFDRIAVQQSETAVALREVAATLKQIDERGTQAYLRARERDQ